MAKRFYKVNEMVWVVADKKKGKVIALDIPTLSARVSVKQEDGSLHEKTVKFMEIDKLKTPNKTVINQGSIKASSGSNFAGFYVTPKKDTVLFAKTCDNAIIPTKRHEDAGYDIYACFEGDHMVLKAGEANLVPTGIASSLLPKYFFSLQHERSSTGKWGMAVLSGLIDSGYRGEWFVNIVPPKYDVVISKVHPFPVKDGKKKPVLVDNVVYYPADLAIAQATLNLVPDVRVKEITYEELKAIPSDRGTGALGSSNK